MPQTVASIKELLAAHGMSPLKTFGQNFLIDHNMLRKLIDAANVQPGEVVLEIGPGTGVLTDELLARNCRVIACEIDRGMCAILRERFAANPNFTLIEGDCLDGKHAIAPQVVAALDNRPFVHIANLPYGAATPVMSLLMAHYPACRGLYVTIQREVGDRLAAKPATKEFGPLSVLAQVTCDVNLIAKLPPSCFWPQPDVTSIMLALTRRPAPLHTNPAGLLAFCHALFEQRRKQLQAVLRTHGKSVPPNVDPQIRAEAMTIPQLMSLFDAVGPIEKPA
ncbi:MAG TPA: 16S rRNA (adenine(1518)-N(6)/adenine(1519)-N(6))-dimethyltransferase RsmA [Phycisphaerales bacterium]|nr:16S rRNA (adenine(1518)-N(6)/adenine(1519)-N(6))-dimethyltransferase RsmA [Phycisphaerales bacterium]